MTYDVLARARARTRRATLLAVIVVALLGLVAVGGWLSRGPRPTAPGAAPSAGGTGTAPVGATSSPSGGVLPADVTWTQLGGVDLPNSARCGPHDTAQSLARGFTHDPAGAVLAAVHLLVRVSPQVGPSVFDPTLRTQVVGPDAADMRAQVAQQYEALRSQAQVAYGQPVGRLYATLRGYHVESVTTDTAVLQILTVTANTTGATVYATVRVHLSWTGGDWALLAPPGGTWQNVVVAATAAQAATFTPFPRPGR